MINSIHDICDLVISGFDRYSEYGNVFVKENDGLYLFNYTSQAQFENRWNYFELVSRGLIISSSGEIVARPFDKFFNWGENNKTTQAKIISATEKVDGSLGILYRYNGQFRIATRGSFDGDQAIWATEFLNENYNLSSLPDSYTLLFEIIYPENRVVVDYGETRDLILLACRNRFTGQYQPISRVHDIANVYGFHVPKMYSFDGVYDILENLPLLDANSEGYVVEFSDGQRFKFKGDKYKELHRLIYMLSFKNTLAAYESSTIDDIRAKIPDEFLEQFNDWVDEIVGTIDTVKITANHIFSKAPKETRKDFAIWVNKSYKDYASYLFAIFDGKNIEPLIYKMAFKNRSDEE